MIILMCNGYGWQGTPEELVSLTDDLNDRDFSFCPHCDSSDFDELKDEEDSD